MYWTNIPNVTQPEDKGILLCDVLESGFAYQNKSHCMTASYNGAEFHNSLKRKQRTMIAEPITLKDKSQTLCSQYHKENIKSLPKRDKAGLFVAHEIGAALRTRSENDEREKRLEARNDGKCNALYQYPIKKLIKNQVKSSTNGFYADFLSILLLDIGITTVQTDSIVCTPVRIGEIGNGGQGGRIYSVYGKTVTIMGNAGGGGSKTGLYKVNLPDGDYTIRKLTPVEAERCQTMPDNYTAMGIDDNGKEVKISNSRRYKATGNG